LVPLGIEKSSIMPVITLAFSPCPNDTFIFYAMTHGKVDTEGITFRYHLADIEALNRLAKEKEFQMVKISYHAWLFLRETWTLLDAGSALGYGNGPLLISKRPYTPEQVPGLTVAIPGEYTTAHLLLRIAFSQVRDTRIMLFSDIEKAILDDTVDTGVIIHENRFTYQGKGLRKIMDLGAEWEKLTGAPVPLGGIVADNDLGPEIITKLNRIMQRSVVWGMEHPGETMPFVREHAQEMDESVMRQHIELYVTGFTVDLGKKGKAAIEIMKQLAHERKIIG